jgi:peptidoglycan/LPS O-acetylase OafA/YrhL
MTDREPASDLARGGALDALRFAAAGFLTVYHFGMEEAPRPLSELGAVFGRGHLATNFFILLSGYVLARTYGPRIMAGRVSDGRFVLGRLGRIWPAHLIVLAAFVVLALAVQGLGIGLNNPEAFRWEDLPRQALLAHAWGFGPAPGWNSASWTLSALAACYLLFPPLYRGLRRVRPQAALAIGIGGLLSADVAARALGADLYTLSPAYGLGRAAPLFLLGATLACYGDARPPARPVAWALGLGGAAVFVAAQAVSGWSLGAVLGLAAVILAAGTHRPRRGSPLVARAAAVSFALFLTHNLVGLVWFRALGFLPWTLPEPAEWALWASAFPACLTAAWMFDRWIDGPVQAWLKPKLNGSDVRHVRLTPTFAQAVRRLLPQEPNGTALAPQPVRRPASGRH